MCLSPSAFLTRSFSPGESCHSRQQGRISAARKTENGRLEIGQILESQIRKQKSRIGQFNLRFLFSGLRYKEGSSPSRLPQHKIFNNEHIEAGGVERLESIARSTCDRLIKVVKRCV